ncbi:hypothetical protein [Edaphobacter modestus]|uniref:Uncharacterized protein n=1 Tax=Edaphobacter modestus TaxID=388466 RepID=A0A4Q7YM76_9BACT|nr:hypothetical protein [Edaphobacter modestus]RZU38832.1 hypothetical protein BDD14_0117 [Edaphobacter modestus]
MSMEVSPSNKPTPVMLVTQAAKSTQEPAHHTPAQVGSSVAAGTKQPPRGTTSQTNQTASVGTEKYKLPSANGGLGERTGSVATNLATVPAANPAPVATTASVTESGEAHQPSEMLQNKDHGEPTSESENPGEEVVRETALETQITELWSSQERKNDSLRRNRAELATLRN